ncbi:MAG: L-serine ammonia-lyase [Bacteriovoracaceae bacterium]|jgi:L-serine dehydratase|nr:L-serine ammonia-lyase [Bacteriovoracaceae bacterium]
MNLSFDDIFKVGIGPSSSHTVGPMKAAFIFLKEIRKKRKLKKIKTVKCDLYGSLALTGKGHGTDKAVLLGLSGYKPSSIASNEIDTILKNIKDKKKIDCKSFKIEFDFNQKSDIKFHRRVSLPFHPNAMAIAAFDKDNNEIYRQTYYSVGGGFIINEDQIDHEATDLLKPKKLKYRFSSAKELLDLCKKNKITISQLMFKNECSLYKKDIAYQNILSIWNVMDECVLNGLHSEGILPGGLKVKRRAPSIFKNLTKNMEKNLSDNLSVLDWVNLYALAVNEENAAGGKVVTAPTNGAAGIIPAVLKYYLNFYPRASEQGIVDFLLTAAAIAILYKENASISGAEVGCQGEVGVACSMAAGALTAVMGGSLSQVTNAAEIAMEHNLGLTCDPIGGLVQIPCIERNAMGAIKAINATRIALQGDGSHFVSLDKVIKTMKQTGKDMKKQYKETSRGGLAVNLPEC